MDGDKTVVKCSGDDTPSRYAGFCAAIVKKLFGSSSAAKKTMDRVEGRTEYGLDEVLLMLMACNSSAMADILLGSIDDVPVKFYDAELGTI